MNRNEADEIIKELEKELEQLFKTNDINYILKLIDLSGKLIFWKDYKLTNEYLKQTETALFNYIEFALDKLKNDDDTNNIFKAIDLVKKLESWGDYKLSNENLKQIETALFNYVEFASDKLKNDDDINYILKAKVVANKFKPYNSHTKFLDQNDSYLKHNINIKTNNNGDDLLKLYKVFGLTLDDDSYYKKQLLLITEDINNLKYFKNEFYFGLWHFLYADADKILKEHKDINFNHYKDERHIAYKKYSGTSHANNSESYYTYLEKIIKSGKPILTLYILNSFPDRDIIDKKSLCNCYIQAFAKLERFDILEKYYENSESLNQNLVFLENMAKYYISQKKCGKAQEVVIRMSQLEPKYHFIEESKTSIERCVLIHKLSSQNIDENAINSLSGYEFESLIISKLREYGFDVKETPMTGDYGADIIAENNNQTKFIIQCKRFNTKVNLKAVQEVTAALAHFNGDIGIVVTNNSFLNSAIKLAESNDIELWDSIKLMRFLAGDISFSSIYE